MKPEEAKPSQPVQEYRVDDPQAAWERFEALAKKAFTVPRESVAIRMNIQQDGTQVQKVQIDVRNK